MRIVLCFPVESRHVAQIAAAARGHEIIDAGQARIAQEILQADIFCGHAKVPMPWPAVVSAGRLRWIQSSAAGLDHCLTPEVIASQITVTSASGVLADQVSEHAIGLTLALCRSLPTFLAAQAKREFVRRPTRDLHRATVGIVGFGGVGRRLAQILSSFKTRIMAVDMYPIRQPSYVEALWAPERLDEMLGQVDILYLAAPLTEKTRGMINAQRLDCLRPHALLVNMARGPLVVEKDLVAALEGARLAGAALDVTEIEPLPATSRLWDLPNVVITPHVAGQSARRIDDMTNFFCDNLGRYLEGGSLKNLVDKRLGFPEPVADETLAGP